MDSGAIVNYTPQLQVSTQSIVPTTGPFFYWSFIQNLTGANTLTDLAAQDISVLPANALIEVVIASRGASEWLRVMDTSNPTTDLNAGILKPNNYDAALRPYVLHREDGF